MSETYENRLKRMRMRSTHRGIKEMDIILGRFCARLEQMDADTLDLYDALLWENDQELYTWVSGQTQPPSKYAGLIAQIADEVGATGPAAR